MDTIEIAWNQIEDADLPAPVYRTAVRLLRKAARNPDGYVQLSRPELMSLCGTDAGGAMRRHLTQLQSIGIIQYRTFPDQTVMIRMTAMMGVRTDGRQ